MRRLLLILIAAPLFATTYYVDCAAADDTGNGTSTGTAWKTIAKVNASTFAAGDSVLFNKGCTWLEQLTAPSSGSAGSPITFGAYGAGANPIMDASLTVTAWTPATSSTDNGAVFTVGGSTENTTLGTTRNYRWVLTAAMITASADHVTVTFKGSSAGSGSIAGVGICERSGTANCVGSMTRLTFGGANNVTVPFSTEVTTDAVAFALDETKAYLVSYYTTNRSQEWNVLGGYVTYNKDSGPDESQSASVSGYSTTWAGYLGVKRVNSVTVSAPPNIYTASVATAPQLVYRNGAVQPIASSLAALDSTHVWYYSSGALSIYSAADPTGDSSTWLATARNYGVLILNKSYITVQDIDARYAQFFGFEISGSSNITLTHVNASLGGSSGISVEQASATVLIQGGSAHDNGGAVGADSNGIGTGGLGNPSTGIVIDGVHVYGNTNDQIEVYGPAGGASDVLIKNCLIEGGTHNTSGGGIRVSGPGIGTVTIHHNIIRDTHDHGIIAVGAAVPELRVYHNTITGNRTAGLYMQNGNWVVKNNIVQTNDAGSLGYAEFDRETTAGTLTSDYNYIHRTGTSADFSWNGSNVSFATWKTNSSGDAHSANADAQINSTTLIPNGGSPVIRAGVYIAGVSTKNPPDIGALQTPALATGNSLMFSIP